MEHPCPVYMTSRIRSSTPALRASCRFPATPPAFVVQLYEPIAIGVGGAPDVSTVMVGPQAEKEKTRAAVKTSGIRFILNPPK